jgi:hypothetical protein
MERSSARDAGSRGPVTCRGSSTRPPTRLPSPSGRNVQLCLTSLVQAGLYAQRPGMFGSRHLLTFGMVVETPFVVSVSTMLLYET